MKNEMKNLPLGIQTFRKIIEGNFVYADKTKYIYDLIQRGQCYFLSRPRRFGKSLLISTMDELFSGNRGLFKGLWIDSSDYDFNKYPIVRLSMGDVNSRTPEALETGISCEIKTIAGRNQINIEMESPESDLRRLIEGLYDKYDKRVVVLIDEYDKPIVDRFLEVELAKKNRDVLSGFYTALKGLDEYLKFIFITGVAKISNTSIFSGLNNLKDISLNPKFANICGFTIDDFDFLFSDSLLEIKEYRKTEDIAEPGETENSLRDLIFTWYDGYSWDGKTRVLNPFSLLNFFDTKELESFWFRTGTPTLLLDLIKKHPSAYEPNNLASIIDDDFNSIDIDKLPLKPLLFQTGYLTIDKITRIKRIVNNKIINEKNYILKFPNHEVSTAFNRNILSELIGVSQSQVINDAEEIRKALTERNPNKLQSSFKRILSSIPYNLHNTNEAYYHSILLIITMLIDGIYVKAEESTAHGKSDLVISTSEGVKYIFEIKFKLIDVENTQKIEEDRKNVLKKMADEALAQIKEKKYDDKYLKAGSVVIIGAICIVDRTEVLVIFVNQTDTLP